MLTKLILRTLALMIVFSALLGIQGDFAESQVDVAEACNPCDCPQDSRINCQGIQFYAIYTKPEVNPTTGLEFCEIKAYRLGANDEGFFAFKIDTSELAELSEAPEENTLIEEKWDIAFYHLSSGEFQVNAGPDAENKIYTVIFRGCPAEDIREESFYFVE